SLEAERLRASGDRRGHSAIMADAAANALIGREGGIEPATFDVGVIITDRALLDPEGADPAVIEGYGTVPPEQLRSELREALRDRKSTRLNSSHVSISYAVFCLKKKTRTHTAPR